MPLRPFGPNRMPTSAVMLTVSGLAVVGMALASPGALLERNLEQALNAAAGPSFAAHAVAAGGETAQISGSEDFWLSTFSDDHGRNIVPAVSVGDSITVNSSGARKTLRVTAIKEIPGGEVTRIDTSGRTRVFVVTCQDTSRSGSEPIKFLMEMDIGALDGVATKPNRSL